MKANRSSTLRKITARMAVASAPVQVASAPLVPVQVASAPVTHGHDDTVMIFRSYLLRTQGDGCELRAALDRMAERAPKIAAQVIFAASLGEISRGRAVASLRGYLDNGVAVAPLGL